MKKLLIIIICALLSTSSWAATLSLEGHVTDAATSEPLPGVSIVCPQTKAGTVTDLDGF